MLWTKEKLKRDLITLLPKDLVILKWTFFHPQNLVVTGYCPENRVAKLKQIEALIKRKFKASKWNIKINFGLVSGHPNPTLISAILNTIPFSHIVLVSVNELNNIFTIKLRKKLNNSILLALKDLERKYKIIIYLKIDSRAKISINALLSESEQDLSIGSRTQVDLDNKIRSLLPSWIISPSITLKEKKILISVKNGIKDSERLSFLKILLESQLGQEIQIKQNLSLDNKLDYSKEIISKYLTDYEVKIETDNLIIHYSDLPISKKVEALLKKEITKKTSLKVLELHSLFLDNIDAHCVKVKDWILTLFPDLGYCFVYFSVNEHNDHRFHALIPEEAENLIKLELIQEKISKHSPFDSKIEVHWIEDRPDEYLTKRIFYNDIDNVKLKRVEFTEDDNSLRIYYEGINKLREPLWKKILLRLTRFDITFIESNNETLTKKIFDYIDYVAGLDQEDIIELIYKYMPEDANIKTIIFDQHLLKYIITFDNMLLFEFLAQFKIDFESRLQISLGFVPLREISDYIHLLRSRIPDWMINPRIVDHNSFLELIVQNDYEEEPLLQKFVRETSEKLEIKVKYKILLSKQRIQHIIESQFNQQIHIGRLKVYPAKKFLYLEGNLSQIINDEDFEDIISRIEFKTGLSIEPYIKKNPTVTQIKTVHELMEDLKTKYEIKEDFPEQVLAELRELKPVDLDKLKSDRINLVGLDCFSIDSYGTKVIDDCVSIQKVENPENEDEILVGIHVSDLSVYFSKDSAIEKEARRRGFTVYLPKEKKTIPIYPEAIITNASLKQLKVKPAISLFLRLNLDLNVKSYFINKTIIENKKQFTMQEVNEILLEQDQNQWLTDLQLLANITTKFRQNRIARGSINLDSRDSIADLMVSELMIMANSAIGHYFQMQVSGQKIYRNQKIKPYSLIVINAKLSKYGYTIDLINKNPLTEINRVLNEAIINGDSALIYHELKSSLSNAYFSHSCIGHESLGSKWYSQWTSPLRKYMDLTVQRILNGELIDDLQDLCQYQSAIERVIKSKLENQYTEFIAEKISSLINKDSLRLTLNGSNSKRLIFSTSENLSLVLFNDSLDQQLLEELIAIGMNNSILIHIKKISKEKKDYIAAFNIIEASEKLLSYFKNKYSLIYGKILFHE